MNDPLHKNLSLLTQDAHRPLLRQGLRGIERETLRVSASGTLAMTPHPPGLGSALTHAQITTDYSESLLEFITPAEHDIASALGQLDAIHRFAYTQLGDELLWGQSMPGLLPPDDQIPIAWYGQSHIGMLKHVYRRGLALRYGRTMQCIAGIHYNFSLAEPVWEALRTLDPSPDSVQDYQSERYIALIRNFLRQNWLLMYLFGASPVLPTQFMRGRPHRLETLSNDTLYLPYATSLRMSDLGYQNDAQTDLMPPYNSLFAYMQGLAQAVRRPYPRYEALGLKRDGEWWQINSNVLQIENEYYATIRPKRVIRTGERPLEALCARGVQYVEVRCLDVDPFTPVGLTLQSARFLDVFLHLCALDASPWTDADAARENTENFARTVKEGRRPGLTLSRSGQSVALRDWGLELLDRMAPIAELLDSLHGHAEHAQSLQAQRAKLASPALTPSARVLEAVRAQGGSYPAFGLALSQAHAAELKSRPLSEEDSRNFQALAEQSLQEQAQREAESTGSFDDFIQDYRSRTPSHLCC